MKILNFGSLNVDYVCSVEEIVKPGQTVDSTSFTRFPGGKGMNQSLALARAGVPVFHGGIIGEDGAFLRTLLEESGVDCRYLKTTASASGSAFIQVDRHGQNSIVLIGGANRENTRENCDRVLADFEKGDFLLLQNEISELPYLINRAYEKGMRIILNPSPMNSAVTDCDLQKVSMFILNEDEGCTITGETDPEQILEKMHSLYPGAEVVLTLGGNGSVYTDGKRCVYQQAYRVHAVDTTAAGDTFTGYVLSGIYNGLPMEECLRQASMASAIAVTRPGAASSIPEVAEVRKMLAEGQANR